MDELLTGPYYWHWFAAGVLLIALEVVVPGASLIWIGVSAALTGVVVLIFQDMGVAYQFLIFAGLGVATALSGRRWIYKVNEESDRPLLNRRGEQFIGKRYTLSDPIVNGSGRLKIGDSTWKISGRDMPAGTAVVITAVEGSALNVEPEQ